MEKRAQEWLRQGEYDLATAEYMFSGGRYFYAAFMCHLAVEKALKGIYVKRIAAEPPRTHNLLFLVKRVGLALPAALLAFVTSLNTTSVATRYPDDLDVALREHSEAKVKITLEKAKETVQWIRMEFQK